MTRATLLQLLTHPTAIAGADVRALEKLAEAFPYCQTAHLLLAKAAHDQGSMLAGQHLRRAATYAADRSRLRQLLELMPPAAPVPEPLASAPLVPVAELAALAAEPTAPLREPAAMAPEFPAPEPEAPLVEPIATPSARQPVEQASVAEAPATFVEAASETAVDFSATSLAENLLTTDSQADNLTTALPEQPEVAVSTPAAELVVLPDELPAQAPPIRPPAEAVAAHAEFGLAEASPVELMAYQLPELVEPAPEPAASAIAEASTPRLPPFRGVADIGYAPSEGSRLGFCLLLSATEPTASSLPPTGDFFAPDALLLAHLAALPAPALPKVSSLDLINSFLKRAPTPARRRPQPLAEANEQADLSVRSTRPELDLASESLAKILVRQGKIDRAIAVYERLMVKHPEKMAYFAAQIESLRTSA